jgi:hypothetical protein
MRIEIMQSKPCSWCSAEFERPSRISQAQWDSRRFCSKKCSGKRLTLDVSDISSRYLGGQSSSEIAAEIGISPIHVRRILKSAAIPIRGASENKKLCGSKPEFREKMRLASTGRPLSEEAKNKLRQIFGPKHACWKSGITISEQGYLMFTSSRANGAQAGKALHTVVAEWKYGRKVQHGEHVHHADGNKLNNDPNNLIILTASEHARVHKFGSIIRGKRS